MKSLWLVTISLMCLICLGCSSDDDDETQQANPAAADSLVNLGNIALEQALFDLINGPGPEQPEDIDLSEPYDFYSRALTFNGDHPTANFGIGMLEVMMMSRDPEVQSFFDWMKEFIDADNYFEVPPPTLQLPDGPSPILRLSDLGLPVLAPVKIARRMSGALDDDPRFSDMQDILLTELLPRVDRAIDRLDNIAGNETFVFTITPRMQGDDFEDPAELDQTEVRATIAGMYVVKALCLQLCSYDLDFDAYNGAGMLAAFSQGSDYATLLNEGQARMNSARSAWLNAINFVNSGINFLEHETDSQSDDIIRIDPYDDLTQRDLDTLKHYLPLVQNSLNSTQVFMIDTDGDDGTAPEPITISLFNFFDSPLNDFKALFPAYTVALDTQAVESEYNWNDSLVSAIVHVSQTQFYNWYRQASYEYGEERYSYDSRSFSAPAWDTAFENIVNQYSNSPYLYVSMNYYGTVQAGTDTVESQLYWNYEVATRSRFVPVITWQATNFSQWILPDPTFSGLFPAMTDAEFKRIFDVREESWERTQTWYLW